MHRRGGKTMENLALQIVLLTKWPPTKISAVAEKLVASNIGGQDEKYS